MIQAFVDRFMANREQIAAKFAAAHPSYEAIVRAVIEGVTSPDEYGHDSPDPERIHTIDDGDYQGTLLYVIAEKGYQPSTYWAVAVGYGSCSGCDTLQSIQGWEDGPPTPAQIEEYMTLALHVVQGLKLITGYGDDS